MKIRTVLAVALIVSVLAAPIAAQGAASTPLSTRKILAKVNLVSNEILYADEITSAIAELEKVAKGQKMSSKDKQSLIMQKIDDALFRQFGARESIKVAD